MYTPFLLNPRIFPALVSATVAASEAMILLGKQGAAEGCGLDGAAAALSASRLAGAAVEPANPAQDAAMPPRRARRPPANDVKWSSDNLAYDSFLIFFMAHPLSEKMRITCLGAPETVRRRNLNPAFAFQTSAGSNIHPKIRPRYFSKGDLARLSNMRRTESPSALVRHPQQLQ